MEFWGLESPEKQKASPVKSSEDEKLLKTVKQSKNEVWKIQETLLEPFKDKNGYNRAVKSKIEIWKTLLEPCDSKSLPKMAQKSIKELRKAQKKLEVFLIGYKLAVRSNRTTPRTKKISQ